MTLQEFIEKAKRHVPDADQIARSEQERQQFTNRWPLSNLSKMSIREYSGREDRDTFVYWLEFKKILAGIGGGNASKFGLYCGADGKYIKGRGDSKTTVEGLDLEREFRTLKEHLVEVIFLGRQGKAADIERLDCAVWDMVLLKILMIYVPEKFLVIASKFILSEVASTLQILDPKSIKESGCIVLNYEINKRLDSIPETASWTALERGTFIYNEFEHLFDSKNEDRTLEMVTVGFYLSKFSASHREHRFPGLQWNEIYDSFFLKLGGQRKQSNFRNSLKSIRDGFDSHLGTDRKGWRDPDGSPAKLNKNEMIVFEKSNSLSEPELWDQISGFSDDAKPSPIESSTSVSAPERNIILYGPPGVGKTYRLVYEALRIIDGHSFENLGAFERRNAAVARLNELRLLGQVETLTFHQSYSYEEFIEGISPVIDSTDKLRYEIKDGIFKKFVKRSRNNESKTIVGELSDDPTVWRLSLRLKKDPTVFQKCLDAGVIGLDFAADTNFNEVDSTEYFSESDSSKGKGSINAFINEMQIGDLVCIFNNARSIKAVGVITSEYSYSKTGPFAHLRNVKWISKEVFDIFEINGRKKMMTPTIHRLNQINAAALLQLVGSTATGNQDEKKRYVFIIDEINRGNISKIFGELITLLEPDKREGPNGIPLRLPYSGEEFIIPANVFLIGTMNTTDRSIAMIDVALRRRFSFEEMEPISSLVPEKVADLFLRSIFESMNQKISLLQGRDFRIGHSYFMSDIPLDIPRLKIIWFQKILPLVNEYFYEEWEKIKAIVGSFVTVESKVRNIASLNLLNSAVYRFRDKNMSDDEFTQLMRGLEPKQTLSAEVDVFGEDVPEAD